LGPAQCYSPDPLKLTAPDVRSDRASVATVPPPSGRSCRTTPCHLSSRPPGAGHAAAPPHVPSLSPLTLICYEHRQEGKARLIFPTCNSSVTSAFSRCLPLLQCRALPRQPPPLRADRKPPRAVASSAESSSPWTASFGHPLTPPAPLQAPPVCCDARRPLHCCRCTLLRPLTGASSAPTMRHCGTAYVVSPPL
jgi:hypothetical protein